MSQSEPSLERSLTLQFIGDWGQANFHRVCSWLCEEFCRRAGQRSRIAIWSIRGGGIEALDLVQDGEADLCIITPASFSALAVSGGALFKDRPAPNLKALGVLPQNDCMMLAIDPKWGITSFAQLREARPPLKIAASSDDGTNFIGYVGRLLMEAHGIDEKTLRSWGGTYIEHTHPKDSLALMRSGMVDAVLQEAVMTPWWADIVESGKAVPLQAEPAALAHLASVYGLGSNTLPARYWKNSEAPLLSLDFSDFLVLVRDDMPEDIAHLLTWCLVETREVLERQYRHIPAGRSPLTYPMDPKKMAQTSIPLHPGAQRYYETAGYLQR